MCDCNWSIGLVGVIGFVFLGLWATHLRVKIHAMARRRREQGEE